MNNQNIPQLATIKITCNGETGTALMYFPQNQEYMYVLTAKHCLMGEEFDKTFVPEDIQLDKIFNAETNSLHSYQLTKTDIALYSASNDLDIALLILPLKKILPLIGKPFDYHLVNMVKSKGCLIRGFSQFTQNQDDRSFKAEYVEEIKDKPGMFIVKSEENLDSYYQSALQNVRGLSGSGLFVEISGTIYLAGIIHTYQDKNLFLTTRIPEYNHLIPADHAKFSTIAPEENKKLIDAFDRIQQNAHSIKRRAQDTIATIKVHRDLSLARNLISANRMLVLYGKAGVGKSAMAKSLVEELENSTNFTLIAFTAEQLHRSTLKDAFTHAGLKVNLKDVLTSPLSKQKIVIWIESFEKLIEAGTEGAFAELLELFKEIPQLNIVVTIRDYLVQTFKILYQYELPSQNIFCAVQEFSAQEIKFITDQLPEITPLFENPKLHSLLSNPYYLDKAVRIYPQLLKEENLDEENFKRLMWAHIIEAGNKQRGKSFSSIALKRAKEMSLFTLTSEPNEVIEALVKDNILQVEDGELANRYAPAHDILEDWALIRYIKQKRQQATSHEALIINLDKGPAIRRAFRLWLDEFYRLHPQEAHEFSINILTNQQVENSWKNELIIAVLRSENAQPMFEAMKSELLEPDNRTLKQFIHLLQTCCKNIKTDQSGFDDLVPVGSGWDSMIDFLWDNYDVIGNRGNIDILIAEIIKDWAKQLPDFNPQRLPPASKSAALFLLQFLQKQQVHVTAKRRKYSQDLIFYPIFQVLFKLTSVIKDQIEELIKAAVVSATTDSGKKWYAKPFLRNIKYYVIDSILSDQICKYFPDLVIAMAKKSWREKEPPMRAGVFKSLIIEEKGQDYWGMDDGIDNDYEQPSAYQTFYYWMLLHHPEKAISFLIELLNPAFEKNATALHRKRENIKLINLVTHSGTHKTYFGGEAYWSMYRTILVLHQVIQSILMALEKGLIDRVALGAQEQAPVQDIISRLIEETNNVAVLGTIASILQACPDLLDKHSVVLFGVKEFYNWDSQRYMQDRMLQAYYGTDPVLGRERNLSNALKYRIYYFRGMIGFVADYSFYYQTLNPQLFVLLDKLWAEADDSDQMWKKVLYDMDRRKHVFKPIAIPGYENYVQLVPEYDEKVIAAISPNDQVGKFPEINIMWATNVFERNAEKDTSFSAWERGYRSILETKGIDAHFLAPGVMAALAYRDYYSSLNDEQKTWAREHIIQHAASTLKPTSHRNFMGINMDITRGKPLMFALPLLFKDQMPPAEEKLIKEYLFRLLLSQMDFDIQIQLETSIAESLWKLKPAFASACWYGLIKYSNQCALNAQEEDLLDFDEKHLSRNQRALQFNIWTEQLIKNVVEENTEPVQFSMDKLEELSICYFSSALRIINPATTERIHHDFFQYMLTLHLNYLGGLAEWRHKEFNESRNTFKSCYSIYLLNQPAEHAKKRFKVLLDRTVVSNKEINSYIREILEQFIYEIDRRPEQSVPLTNFWLLWNTLKKWLVQNKEALLLPVFLLDIKWKEHAESWLPLKGKKHFYDLFLREWGFNTINASLRLLAGIGFTEFMPSGILIVTGLLQSENGDGAGPDLLEKLTHKCFFKHGKQIRTDSTLLAHFLYVLDFMIEGGSSKAYLLKEELIQYK